MTADASHDPTHTTPVVGSTSTGPSVPRCEHVWIVQRTLDSGRAPGLLLAFRRHRQHRWEGWVIWATPGIPAQGGEPYLQLGWVDAERIRRRE